MNKKNLLLTVLFAISATQTMLPAEQEQSPKGWKKLCQSYATTLIAGGLIGGITGGVSTYAIEQAFKCIDPNSDPSGGSGAAFLISIAAIWITENRLRNTLVNETNQGFEENGIQYRKNLTRDIAWITAWVAFLMKAPKFS